MASKKNMRITYPASEKIYIPGEINKIKVGMRKIKLLDTVTIDENGEQVFKKNNPVIVYDTSGPFSDPKINIDINAGIPRIREEWCSKRKDIEQLSELSSEYGRAVTFPTVPKKVRISPRCIMPNDVSSLRKWNMWPYVKTSKSKHWD